MNEHLALTESLIQVNLLLWNNLLYSFEIFVMTFKNQMSGFEFDQSHYVLGPFEFLT